MKGISAAMAASQEELFGPVVAFYKFDTEAEVVKVSNNTSVGLAAYI